MHDWISARRGANTLSKLSANRSSCDLTGNQCCRPAKVSLKLARGKGSRPCGRSEPRDLGCYTEIEPRDLGCYTKLLCGLKKGEPFERGIADSDDGWIL